MKKILIKNKDNGDIWEYELKERLDGFALELKITEHLRTRNWEFVKPNRFWAL